MNLHAPRAALIASVAASAIAGCGGPSWNDEASLAALARTPLRSPQDIDVRRAAIRKSVLDATGLDLARRRPVGEVVRRQLLQEPGYLVEGIALESVPGFLLTANLYRPSAPGPKPAVIHFHGHIPHDGLLARMHPDIQTLSATIAEMGAIVIVSSTWSAGASRPRSTTRITGCWRCSCGTASRR